MRRLDYRKNGVKPAATKGLDIIGYFDFNKNLLYNIYKINNERGTK